MKKFEWKEECDESSINIEKLALTIVTMERKWRSYFQGHRIMVITNYPGCQVPKKPNMKSQMISWSVEMFEYDIKFFPLESINSQVIYNFLI